MKSIINLTNSNHRPGSLTFVRCAPLLALTAAIALVCALVANRLWHQDTTVTLENRLIENIQVAFLILATLLHALQSSRLPAIASTDRLCHQILAMLCLSIMVRELDIDRLGPQAGWAYAENLIRLAGGGVWIWLLARVYGHRRHLWHARISILCTPNSVLTGAGVLFYVASWFFDKSVVPLPAGRSQLWEETLQMSGTVALFTAALRPITGYTR